MKHWMESKHHKRPSTIDWKVFGHLFSEYSRTDFFVNILAVIEIIWLASFHVFICALLIQQNDLEDLLCQNQLVTSLSDLLESLITCSFWVMFWKWRMDSFWLCIVKFAGGLLAKKQTRSKTWNTAYSYASYWTVKHFLAHCFSNLQQDSDQNN